MMGRLKVLQAYTEPMQIWMATAATGISQRLNAASMRTPETPEAAVVDIYFFFVSFPKNSTQRVGGNANSAMSAMTNKNTNRRNAKAIKIPQVFQSTRNSVPMWGI